MDGPAELPSGRQTGGQTAERGEVVEVLDHGMHLVFCGEMIVNRVIQLIRHVLGGGRGGLQEISSARWAAADKDRGRAGMELSNQAQASVDEERGWPARAAM